MISQRMEEEVPDIGWKCELDEIHGNLKQRNYSIYFGMATLRSAFRGPQLFSASSTCSL